MKSDLNNIIQSGHLVRYHTTETTRNPTLSEHIYGVLVILDQLYLGKVPENVFRGALYHDVAEYHTGDLPHPFKRSADSELLDHLTRSEEAYLEKIGLELVEISWSEEKSIKLADILEMGFFAAREIRMGNSYAYSILEKVEAVVDELLDWFLIPCTITKQAKHIMADILMEAENGCK